MERQEVQSQEQIKKRVLKTLAEMEKLIYSNLSAQILREIKNKDVVVFLGNTKAGKSTVVNYVIGNQLRSVKERKRHYRIEKCDDRNPGPAIGQGSTSETTIPTRWSSSKITGTIVDAPGFDDNRGEAQDVANSFYIKELISNAKTVKFVLISDINDILQNNIGQFINFIDKVHTILPNVQDYQEGIAIVFSKDEEDTTFDEIKQYLTQKVLEPQSLKVKKELISYFTANSDHVAFFRMPEKEGVLNDRDTGGDTIVNTIENKVSKLPNTILSKVTPGISDKSRLFLLNAHIALCEMPEFDNILKVVREEYLKLIDISGLGSNDEVREKRSQVLELELHINHLKEQGTDLMKILEILKETEGNERIQQLISDDNICTKVKFMSFVDQILKLEQSKIFMAQFNAAVSQIGNDIAKIKVELQMRLQEISIEEAKKANDELRKRYDEEQKELKEKISALEEHKRVEIDRQKQELGLFAKVGDTLDTAISNVGSAVGSAGTWIRNLFD